ncbi:MAG TPA: hypothetical protein VFI39_08925 [Gemmatimonadales bacterium]|nr:hypothetical protein [Gemmatimonadales bacterium]
MSSVKVQSKWAVTLDREGFARISADPRLRDLVIYARITNAIRFAQLAGLQVERRDSPSDNRQRFHSFLFVAALFAEARKIAETVGERFRHLPAFTKHIRPFLADKSVEALWVNHLLPLRDSIVFHFDDKQLPEHLRSISRERYVFATAHGPAKGDIYFPLADELAIASILGSRWSPEEFADLLRRTVDAVTRLADGFDALLPQALQELGWQFEQDDGA